MLRKKSVVKAEKRPKKPSVAKLKKKAWTLFSLLVRLRDTDKFGFGRCCSCGKTYHLKELQAGHFISRRHSATLFELTNVHAQCQACNIWNHGNTIGYWQFMEDTYGRMKIDDLIAMSKASKRFTVPELELMCDVFKSKIEFYDGQKVQSLQ